MASTTSKPPSSDRLPSYARPTAASKIRSTSDEQISLSSQTPRSPRKTRLSSPFSTSLGGEVFRYYSLSTIASRSKARCLGPFRLFDLPPELRNKIYELAGVERASRHFDLRHPNMSSPLQPLPQLLQANKQFLYEAGSYYFPTGSFEILIDQSRISLFINWLKVLGPSNRERLASNSSVTVRVVHKRCDCELDPIRTYTFTKKKQGYLRFEDVVRLVFLEHDYQRIAETYPALRKWRFTSECDKDTRVWHDRDDNGQIDWSTAFRSEAEIPTRVFAGLRPLLKGLYAVLEGREVDMRDEPAPA